MRDGPNRRHFLRAAAALPLVGAFRPAAAQQFRGAYREVLPVLLPLDRPGVWTLHFEYIPVRITKLDVRDKGRRPVWYMVYRVYNTTDTPQRINPTFELVTKDDFPPASYLDEPYPTLVEQIAAVEDPTGARKLRTFVGMGAEPVPVTKADSVPRYVYGVAVWEDVTEKSPRTNAFSVYVGGLSNGKAVEKPLPTDAGKPEDATEIVRAKTLQLDFIRPTDNRRDRTTDIRVADNNGLGGEQWIYKVVSSRKPAAAADPGK